MPVNSDGGSSNFNSLHNYAFSTSGPYFAHPRTTASGGNISNNKAIMIGFDDGWKSQITYAK
ncbi:MAG: hypothetical protein WA323_15265, partial [Candidatus Nitrosopolaris sp.]